MIILSDRSSIAAEKISALAIVETITAIVISALIYRWTNSVAQIVWSVVVAPFLLLRTDRSTDQALTLASKIIPPVFLVVIKSLRVYSETVVTFAKKSRFLFLPGFISVVVAATINGLINVLAAVLLAFSIKIVVTCYNIIVHPLECLAALPRNWRRIVLCTDSATLPELIPGTAESRFRDRLLSITIEDTVRGLFDGAKGAPLPVRLPSYALGALITLVIYLPAAAYRLSLKSTALIWSPLLWATRPIQKAENTAHFAKGILYLTKNKISRWYSGIVILLFSVKFVIWIYWLQLDATLKQFFTLPAVERYVAPADILTWHLAALINSFLTWWMYFRADEYLHDLSQEATSSPDNASNFFSAVPVLRNVLTIYTLFCSAYITASFSSHLELPPLRIVLVPW